MNTPPDPLDPLLDRWSETPDPSPRLSANVWQRIALSERESAGPQRLVGPQSRLGSAVRPLPSVLSWAAPSSACSWPNCA